MIIEIVTISLLYVGNSLLKSPKKLLDLFIFNKLKKKVTSSKKVTTKKVEEPVIKEKTLRNFKLSKAVIKEMIKEKFIYESDFYSPNYSKLFEHSLENYLLFKFPTVGLDLINYKLDKLLTDEERLQIAYNYVRELV